MLEKITYRSKFDRSLQPAYICRAEGETSRPLLVALHTWSYSCEADCSVFYDLCKERNWNMIFPDFRGPNCTPEACGSDLVVSDLEDAVEYMCSECSADRSAVYLVGGSGGGHCALLLAGRRPDLWTAVSSWCPISDIALWHQQSKLRNSGYAEHIESACGGDPAESETALREARLRSPLTWLKNAAGRLPVDISTGIHDGHTGSVPVGQAIRAFNTLAAENDRISEDDIAFIEETESVPEHLKAKEQDPAFGSRTIHLRKTSGMVRLTLFEGGHEAFPAVAAEWLARQTAGAPADWTPGKTVSGFMGELSK